MHVTASLDLPECKQLLTVSIPPQHTAHADQRHARECCLMQSPMRESTCTRGMPCGGAIIDQVSNVHARRVGFDIRLRRPQLW
jgi:hypothetical protein